MINPWITVCLQPEQWKRDCPDKVIKTLYISFAVLISALFFAHAPPMPLAAESSELDTLMEGFSEDDRSSEDPSDDTIEDVMSGFDEGTHDYQAPSPSEGKEPAVGLDGYLKLGASWNVSHEAPVNGETDWRGLSKLRSEIQIDARAQIWHHWRLLAGGKLFYDAAYGLHGRDDFTDEVLDEYESEAEGREVYLQGRLGSLLDLKIGRQIMVWGRSDNLRITDVLNPLDLREPGLTDIEDLRLPTAMTRLDGYWGQWNLTGIAVHEIRFDKNPVFGHDFFPSPIPLPPDETPSDGGDNTEWALALNGIFSGKDISFYWADLYDDAPHGAFGVNGSVVQKHARVTMWGAAGNIALGNWLLKSEVAYWRGLEFFNSAGQTHERIDGLIGIEYSGWNDTTASWEWAVRHLVDFAAPLKTSPDFAQEDEIINALRISRTYLNETVKLTLLGLIYGPMGQDGSLIRGSVAYDWSDAINVLLGTVLYESGDKYALRNIGDNDRVFAEIKYSF